MAVSKRKIQQELKEDLKQNWTQNHYQRCYSDQFGFKIEYGTSYNLLYKDEFVVKVHSLTAAQMISRIMLNDIVMHKN